MFYFYISIHRAIDWNLAFSQLQDVDGEDDSFHSRIMDPTISEDERMSRHIFAMHDALLRGETDFVSAAMTGSRLVSYTFILSAILVENGASHSLFLWLDS